MDNPAVWFLVIVGALVVWVVYAYNKLIKLRVRSKNAWADIDVQLKRRYDLVPNLVTTVQGYATHEKSLFEKVAELRAQAMGAQGPADSDQPDTALATSLKTVFAVAENYPELRADANFRQLQQQLTEVENHIQYSRRYYNAVVRDMNTAIQVVPMNIIASLFGFEKLAYFQAGEDERRSVAVDFSEKTSQ